MSEKLCLNWNNFQENLNSAFGTLRKDTDLTDVTLACEDDRQIEAHKVVLSVSSPFFENLFKRNKHSHPLVFMRGVKSDVLIAIIDFLYKGEANVFQEQLDSFLALAEELKLKGLTGQDSFGDTERQPVSEADRTQTTRKAIFKNDQSEVNQIETQLIQRYQPQNNEIKLAIPNVLSGDLKALDEKVKSMMEKSENLIANGAQKAYVCKVCGKEGHGIAVRDHIEANHLEGISLPCNSCEKICRSGSTLRKHKCIE